MYIIILSIQNKVHFHFLVLIIQHVLIISSNCYMKWNRTLFIYSLETKKTKKKKNNKTLDAFIYIYKDRMLLKG